MQESNGEPRCKPWTGEGGGEGREAGARGDEGGKGGWGVGGAHLALQRSGAQAPRLSGGQSPAKLWKGPRVSKCDRPKMAPVSYTEAPGFLSERLKDRSQLPLDSRPHPRVSACCGREAVWGGGRAGGGCSKGGGTGRGAVGQASPVVFRRREGAVFQDWVEARYLRIPVSDRSSASS